MRRHERNSRTHMQRCRLPVKKTGDCACASLGLSQVRAKIMKIPPLLNSIVWVLGFSKRDGNLDDGMASHARTCMNVCVFI